MSLIDDIIASVENDRAVTHVCIGIHWTAVCSRHCGLATTLVDSGQPHGHPMVGHTGSLTERTALELAGLTRSNSLLERSVGVAAINSLLEVDEAKCVDLNARDLLRERGQGKSVAVVGHFPFVNDLRSAVKDLWVLELRPQPGDLPAETAAEVIPRADVVAVSGSTIINGTIEQLLSYCRPTSLVVVLGPSTPLSPVLFDYGVDVVSGTIVTDSEMALRYVREGAVFRQVRGVRLVSMTRDRITHG